jgi:DNA-binding transcriptional LysR family regulator
MGHGMTILPIIAVTEYLARKRLSAAPLSHPAIERKLALATSAVRPISTPLRHVLTQLTQCIRSSITEGEWLAARWLGNS